MKRGNYMLQKEKKTNSLKEDISKILKEARDKKEISKNMIENLLENRISNEKIVQIVEKLRNEGITIIEDVDSEVPYEKLDDAEVQKMLNDDIMKIAEYMDCLLYTSPSPRD